MARQSGGGATRLQRMIATVHKDAGSQAAQCGLRGCVGMSDVLSTHPRQVWRSRSSSALRHQLLASYLPPAAFANTCGSDLVSFITTPSTRSPTTRPVAFASFAMITLSVYSAHSSCRRAGFSTGHGYQQQRSLHGTANGRGAAGRTSGPAAAAWASGRLGGRRHAQPGRGALAA
jgi:hypothetical protein